MCKKHSGKIWYRQFDSWNEKLPQQSTPPPFPVQTTSIKKGKIESLIGRTHARDIQDERKKGRDVRVVYSVTNN